MAMSFSVRLANMTTLDPRAASTSANARPIPLDAPDIMTTLSRMSTKTPLRTKVHDSFRSHAWRDSRSALSVYRVRGGSETPKIPRGRRRCATASADHNRLGVEHLTKRSPSRWHGGAIRALGRESRMPRRHRLSMAVMGALLFGTVSGCGPFASVIPAPLPCGRAHSKASRRGDVAQ